MPTHRAIATHSSLVVEALDSVLLSVWTGLPPVADEIRQTVAACTEHAKAWNPSALIVTIPPTMALPSEPIRHVIQLEMRKLDPYLSCGATVIARKGLVGIAHRAIVSAIQLVSRPTHPERIFASNTEAASYVRARLLESGGRSPAVRTIVQKYEALALRAWATKD